MTRAPNHTTSASRTKPRAEEVIFRPCFPGVVLMLVVLSMLGRGPVSLQAQPASVSATAGMAVPGMNPGELLMGELNCIACHPADAAVQARLFSRRSPHLGQKGLRLSPQYLRAFLTNPTHEKPGTAMPDVLHELSGPAKQETVDALVHFLSSLARPNDSEAVTVNPLMISQGRFLYHQVGCVACHAPQEEPAILKAPAGADPIPSVPAGLSHQAEFEKSSVPLGNLAKKFTVLELAQFLANPLQSRPSGRMPSLNLTEGESFALAMYLLREQATATNSSRPLQRTRDLAYDYCEGDFNDTAKLEAARPKASGVVERFLLTSKRRGDYFGIRFTGLISVAAEGEYTFYTASDDGSRLYIDDKLVVDNDGHHGAVEQKGLIPLQAGPHPIRVSYFNNDGGSALKVSYQGPGLSKREIPASALSHLGIPMVPVDEENLIVDARKASRGLELFASLGCAACHETGSPVISSTLRAKPLGALNPEASGGCLDASPRGAPHYQLADSQRQALRSALSARVSLTQPLEPKELVTRTMAALNCFACHARDGVGGPETIRGDYFGVVGGADLGDEGRFPPHLTRVGDKLRPEWLREVLVNKGAARPYMATRMPQFGEANAGFLAAAFEKADVMPRNPGGVLTTGAGGAASFVGYGRKLVGTEGLSCISCHVFAGHKSLGIPAMDLTLVTRRLKREWFQRYLLEPASLRPGTRMPAFWPDGQSGRKDILDGDTGRQIEAVWAYLDRGKEAGLPPGLIQGRMELVATNEAVLYRNFIQGAGTRAIGVGYPEKADLAFDANDLRLALIWHGPFIDAARHRTGRGDGFEGPLGYNVVKMPPGAPFAVLAEAGSQWPEVSGKKAGYHMRGYQLDAQRRPAFLYSFEDLRIRDYPVAVSGDLDASFRRALTFETTHPMENLWFRAWAGTKVEAQSDGSFVAEDKIKFHFKLTSQAKPLVRQSGGRAELLVPVTLTEGKAEIVEEIIW